MLKCTFFPRIVDYEDPQRGAREGVGFLFESESSGDFSRALNRAIDQRVMYTGILK